MATGTTSATIRNIGVKNNEIQWSAIAADALGRAIGHGISAGSRIQMQQANQASKDNFEAAGIPYSTDWRGRPVEADGPPKPAHLMPGYGLDYDMADDGFFDEQGNEAILAQMERDDAAFARAYKNPNVPGMGSADSLFPESRFSGLKPYESDYRGTPIGFDPNVEAAKFNAGLDAMRAAQQATRPSQFNDGLGMMTSPSMQEIAAVMSSSPAIAKELYGLSPNADIDPAKLQMNHFPLDNSGRIAQQKVTNGIMSFLLGASNERDFFDEGVPGFSPVPGAMSSTPIIEELFAGAVVASGKLAAGGLAATMRGTGSLFGRVGVANNVLRGEVARLGQEGHALVRHGGAISDEQLFVRATTGVAPDGSSVVRDGQVVIPPSSTAFYSDELLAQSDLLVRQNYLDRAVALSKPGAQRVTVEGVDVGTAVGRGYDRVAPLPGGVGPLQFHDSLSRVTAVYDFDPVSRIWRTTTIYPTK